MRKEEQSGETISNHAQPYIPLILNLADPETHWYTDEKSYASKP
jgi:hypothetical protein